MITKYIGRPSPWKGKTLYDIACNLNTRGVGRVVYRWSFSNRYPEKSYYRLTKVEPDPTDMEFMKGTAWGIRVFRGQIEKEESQILTGHRADWRLIPKDQEEEFCKISSVHMPKPKPTEMTLPPLLTSLYKQHLEAKGEQLEGPITVKLKTRKTFRREIEQSAK